MHHDVPSLRGQSRKGRFIGGGWFSPAPVGVELYAALGPTRDGVNGSYEIKPSHETDAPDLDGYPEANEDWQDEDDVQNRPEPLASTKGNHPQRFLKSEYLLEEGSVGGYVLSFEPKMSLIHQRQWQCYYRNGEIDKASPRSFLCRTPRGEFVNDFPCTNYPNDMGIAGELGSLLIGGLVAAMLYGVTTLQGRFRRNVQTYVYYMHYSEDASAVKFLVGAVWSFPASLLVNVLFNLTGAIRDIDDIQFVLVGRSGWWLLQSGSLWVWHGLVNKEASVMKQIRWLSDYLLKVTSVRVDNSPLTTLASTKRILATLVVYAINRCILVLLVALAEFATTIELQTSLNTRQYLRSQDSTAARGSNEGIHVVHFQNMSEGLKRSKEEEGHGDMHEAATIDITADPELENATASQTQEEV
ncbi:hypothetical protein EDD15DRAFT_2190625 [Pisolithus albus]|nr:hypothetical protein EDD15DRAFT_2190625 [Pisolithus albus]